MGVDSYGGLKATLRFSYGENGNNKVGQGASALAYWIYVNP